MASRTAVWAGHSLNLRPPYLIFCRYFVVLFSILAIVNAALNHSTCPSKYLSDWAIFAIESTSEESNFDFEEYSLSAAKFFYVLMIQNFDIIKRSDDGILEKITLKFFSAF